MTRSLSRRACVLSGLLAPAAAALAACGGPAGSSQPQLSSKPVKIELATDWSIPTRMAVMEVMKKEFTAKYPNVTVENLYIGGAGGSAEGYSERTVAQLAANTAPDVIANWAFQPYLDRLADLTQDLSKAGWKKADVFYDPYNQEIDGKVYMLSMSASVSGWAYNKNLFGEAGIKDPDDNWTTNDVLEAAKKLTKPDKNQYGMLAPNNALWFGWLEHVWAAGAGSTGATSAEMFNTKQKKSRLGEAGGPAAFEWYMDMIQRHKVAPTLAEQTEKSIRFETGNIGMRPISIYASGGPANTIKDSFVWSAMPIPRDPTTKKRAYDLNSEGFVIPKETRNKGTFDAALRYVLTFYSDPVMREVALQRGTLPIMRKWIDSKEYLSAPPLNLDIIVKTINDKQAIVGDHGGRFKEFGPWIAAVRAEVAKAYNGENTPRPAFMAAMAAGDRVLAAG